MEYDTSSVPVDVEPISHQPGNNEKEDSFTEDAPTNSKSNISKLDMEFDTEEAAYDFYNAYAASVGFSIRRAGKKGNLIVYRKFCCSAQGTKQPDKRDPYYKTHRPETRTNCGAGMTINSRYTRKFKVTEFVCDHNGHELVSPRKSHMLRSHRRITAKQATEIDNLNKSGIAAKASLTFVSQKEGGREKVGYLLQDLKNYLRSKRTIQMPDGDVGGLLNYMQSKQSQDPNFFNAMQVDEDDQITNIFWVDGQMMSDYVYFGDVVSFDTTYRKNKEDRPFGIFVGVNHHRQTVVFGAEHDFMRIPDLYIKRRWTKSAKKGFIDGISQPARTSNVSPGNRNEAEEKLRHGEHYRELCRLFSQLTTRASRADDTFEFAKAGGYKALHEVDAMFDKKQITKPIVTTSHVVKNALVSRVSKEKSVASVEAGGSIDNGVAIAEDCSPAGDETIIRGLKKKQTSKVKSGKRLKSGLEEAIKKRQPRNNKKSSLGKVPAPKPVESNIHVSCLKFI